MALSSPAINACGEQVPLPSANPIPSPPTGSKAAAAFPMGITWDGQSLDAANRWQRGGSQGPMRWAV